MSSFTGGAGMSGQSWIFVVWAAIAVPAAFFALWAAIGGEISLPWLKREWAFVLILAVVVGLLSPVLLAVAAVARGVILLRHAPAGRIAEPAVETQRYAQPSRLAPSS